MFQAIYEVRLAGKDIELDYRTWDVIRDHVRENKWFYLIHNEVKYKYTRDNAFFDRPTRFDFEVVNPEEKQSIDIIYI